MSTGSEGLEPGSYPVKVRLNGARLHGRPSFARRLEDKYENSQQTTDRRPLDSGQAHEAVFVLVSGFLKDVATHSPR